MMFNLICVWFRMIVHMLFVWFSYRIHLNFIWFRMILKLIFVWCSYDFRVIRVWFRMMFIWEPSDCVYDFVYDFAYGFAWFSCFVCSYVVLICLSNFSSLYMICLWFGHELWLSDAFIMILIWIAMSFRRFPMTSYEN